MIAGIFYFPDILKLNCHQENMFEEKYVHVCACVYEFKGGRRIGQERAECQKLNNYKYKLVSKQRVSCSGNNYFNFPFHFSSKYIQFSL